MFRIITALAFVSLVACNKSDAPTNDPTEGDGAASADQQTPEEDTSPSTEVKEKEYGTIEIRMSVSETDSQASAFELEDQTVYLGTAHTFEVHAFPTTDHIGQPALGFEVIETQKAEFTTLTETLIGQKMAILVDAKVVTMPVIHARLQGQGVIQGGAGGFSEDEVLELIASING